MRLHASRLPAIPLWVGAALVAGTTLQYIWTSRLLVPYWDEWDFIDFYREAEAGGATFSGLWALNNGHRLFIPRLLFLARDHLLNGDPLALIGLSILLQASIAAIIVVALLRATRLRGTTLAHVLGAATLVLLTWAVQLENFHWGLQITYVLSAFFAVLAISVLAATPPERGEWRTVAATTSALASCLCLGAGLAVPPALLAVAAAQRRGRRSLAIIGAGVVLSVVLYVGDAAAITADHLAHPVDVVGTLARLLAPPLIDDADRLIIGSILLVGGLAAALATLHTRAGPVGALGIGLMTFGLLASALTVVARFDEIRFHSRYVAFTSLFWVGLLALVGQVAATQRTIRWMVYATLVVLVLPVWAIQTRAAGQFITRADDATATVLALLAGIADEGAIAGRLHPRPEVPQQVLPFLLDRRYGFFGGRLVDLIGEPAIERFTTSPDACDASVGVQVGAHGLRVTGRFVGGLQPEWLVLADPAGQIRGLGARGRTSPNITGFAPAEVLGGTLFGVQGDSLCRAASLRMGR